MAEYVNEDKPMIIVNETDSDFNVGVGLVFRKSGIYEISINDKITTVTKVSERKTGKWIPCSERLPEEDTDILVTYVDGEEARIIPVNYGRGTWFDCIFNSALDSLKVIAWMPLPEAYREGKG